jgi:hypothetical protein
MTIIRRCVLGLAGLLAAMPLAAHHTYALFDLTKPTTVSATVAKMEWRNPHVFVWAYVPDKAQSSGYKLYAFESGSLVVMSRQGWDKDAVKVGEKLTVEYLPLRSGEPGGALLKVTHADGKVHNGDPYGRQMIEQMKASGKAPQ